MAKRGREKNVQVVEFMAKFVGVSTVLYLEWSALL